MEAYRGSEIVTPLILNLRARWKMVQITPQPLAPEKKKAQCPLYRRLGGSQRRFGSWGKEKNLLPKRSLLFWYVTQRRLVLCYWRFRTNYWYHLQGSSSPSLFLWHQQMLHFYGTRIYCVRKSLSLVIPCQLYPVHSRTHVNFTSFSLYISKHNLLNISFSPIPCFFVI